jgi:hypothetical protein
MRQKPVIIHEEQVEPIDVDDLRVGWVVQCPFATGNAGSDRCRLLWGEGPHGGYRGVKCPVPPENWAKQFTAPRTAPAECPLRKGPVTVRAKEYRG